MYRNLRNLTSCKTSNKMFLLSFAPGINIVLGRETAAKAVTKVNSDMKTKKVLPHSNDGIDWKP